jgi:hypothetical protein
VSGSDIVVTLSADLQRSVPIEGELVFALFAVKYKVARLETILRLVLSTALGDDVVVSLRYKFTHTLQVVVQKGEVF